MVAKLSSAAAGTVAVTMPSVITVAVPPSVAMRVATASALPSAVAMLRRKGALTFTTRPRKRR